MPTPDSMSTDSFEKTNWVWQLSQFQQQVGEWLELQFSRFEPALPRLSWSGWSIDAPWIVELVKALVLLLLGQVPLDHQTLVNSWVEQTGRSPAELEQLLRLQSQKRRMSQRELLTWLRKWQTVLNHCH